MTTVVICNALRTPIGRFLGGLSSVRPDDLLALCFQKVIEQSGIPAADIEEVYAGCANQAGEDNRNIARMSALLAGLPQSVPAVTFNRLCASGLEAVHQAFRGIKAGDGEVYLVGGVESMSRAPYSTPRGHTAPKAGNITTYDTSLGWRYPNPKMEKLFPLEAMGCTAENIVDDMNISREDQDRFAYQSHQKAIRAQQNGWFNKELIPVSIPQRKKDPIVVSQDEGPRANTSIEKLATLRPAFRKGGSVTAGNSSTLNDGASAMLVCTEEYAKRHNLQPLAKIISSASAGVNPETMGYGPVPATQKALQKANVTIDDIDIVELNEAFAAQSLGVIRKLGLSEDIVNLHGGAIALGHPLGCSGARILTTLIHAMHTHDKKRGLATLCVGVGQGLSMIVEKV